MLKRKAASEEKKKSKCRFSRYEELRFKYQEDRLKAHAVEPKEPERVEVIVDTSTIAAKVLETVAEYANEWVDEFDAPIEDLSKSVVLEKKTADNIV
jgi:hypothetical protein